MSKRIKNRQCYLPFLPQDNYIRSGGTDEASALNHNLAQCSVLMQMPFAQFSQEVDVNDMLQSFILSYLNYRSKPFCRSSESPKDLQNLDRYIFLIYLRLAKFIEEDCSPARFASKTDSGAGGLRSPVRKADTLGAPRPAHDSLLCFARVIEFLSILGPEKAHMTSKILQGIQMNNEAEKFNKEVCSGIEESYNAVKQLLETCNKLQQQSTTNSVERNSSSSSSSNSGTKSNTSSSGTGRSSGGSASVGSSSLHGSNNEDQLVFVAAFAADISHTLHSFICASALGNTLSSYDVFSMRQQGSRVVCDGLKVPVGDNVINILQCLYEDVIPLIIAVKNSLSTSLGAVEAQGIDSFITTTIYACMECLHSVLTAANAATVESVLPSSSSSSFSERSEKESSSECIAWLEAVLRCVNNDIASSGKEGGESNNHYRGVLFSDYCQKFGDLVLLSLISQDIGKADAEYLLSSAKLSRSLLLPAAADVTQSLSANAPSFQPSSSISSSTATTNISTGAPLAAISQAQYSSTQSIEMIKSVLPDLGQGFVEACLGIYKGNAEAVIDAVLSDNLDPRLNLLDRSMDQMWIGKRGGADDVPQKYGSKVSSSNKKESTGGVVVSGVILGGVDHAAEQARLQAERVRAMERQEEYDHSLLAREYQDDYDDQYEEEHTIRGELGGGGGRAGGGKTDRNSRGDDGYNNEDGEHNSHLSDNSSNVKKHLYFTKDGVRTQVLGGAPTLLNKKERRQAAKKGLLVPAAPAREGDTASSQIGGGNMGIQNPKGMSSADIGAQMAEMKRLNYLLRQQESEDKYWEDMKNTNHTPGGSALRSTRDNWKRASAAAADHDSEGDDNGEQEANKGSESMRGVPGGPGSMGVPSKAKTNLPPPPALNIPAGEGEKNGKKGSTTQKQQQPKSGSAGGGKSNGGGKNHGGGGGGGSGGGGGGGEASSDGNKKKFRTKTFDKHHQKDKATRKMG